MSACNSLESLKVLDNNENLKKLVIKLPVYLHDKWRNIVMCKNLQREITNLVRTEAKKANDPV